jgi:hypothetical protein
LANKVAHLLMGKHKPIFSPANDCGDFVIITNASKMVEFLFTFLLYCYSYFYVSFYFFILFVRFLLAKNGNKKYIDIIQDIQVD